MILSLAIRLIILVLTNSVWLNANAPPTCAPDSDHVSSRQVGSNKIAYYDCGQGPVLVLIHGMFGDHLDWEPVLEPLARRQRVIAIDLPGFGASDKPNREYTGEFFVDSLHGLLQELSVQRATLVGNSFGGQIALLYALRYPGEVKSLILVDSGGFRPFTEQEKELTRQRFSEAAIAALTPEINEMLFAPLFSAPSEMRQRYLQKQNTKLGRTDYPAYAHAVASSIQLSISTFLLDRLPEIECPTLLLWGEKDQAVPLELARQALEKLPRARLKVVPGCGHVPQLDCPAAFLPAVEGFLESLTD